MNNRRPAPKPSAQCCRFGRVARAYLGLGIPAIPLCPPDHVGMSSGHLRNCSNPGKTPLVSDWPKYGQRLPTVDVISRWDAQWPNANVGGPTGPLLGIALDIDPRHGGDTELESRGWEIPKTPTSLTGGDGSHHIFNHPKFKVPNKVAMAPGIDLRGDGGQIVLPPSLHASGKQYQWGPSLRIGITPLASPQNGYCNISGLRQSRGQHGMIGYWTLMYRELRWASVTPPATGWPADGWPRALLPLKWSISSYHGLLLVSPLWEAPLATQDRRYGSLQRSPLLRSTFQPNHA